MTTADAPRLKILVVGAGVIGTVYGAHLSAAGHAVSVLAHGLRTDEIARDGLRARDVYDDADTSAPAHVVADAGGNVYDLILVAVRREQISVACGRLAGVSGTPSVLIFGNNLDGRTAIGINLPGTVWQGFPGVGGVLTDGLVRYIRITQQPTAVQTGTDPALVAFASSLRARGFAVTPVADMDSWLAYHGVFVACVSAALYRCGTDPVRLAADRALLRLMCRAISEGFAAEKAVGRRGLPGNLAILHHPLLRLVAMRYWAGMMRTPMGELCFAAHARHAEPEMRTLGADVLAAIGAAPRTRHLDQLLA